MTHRAAFKSASRQGVQAARDKRRFSFKSPVASLPPPSRGVSRRSEGLFLLRQNISRFNIGWCLFSIALLLAACAQPQNKSTPDQAFSPREFTDETGRRVQVRVNIGRVVSLAPNLTEIVYAVGAGNRLVGRTSFCNYPPEAKQVIEVGDTQQPNIERIISLQPDLVLVTTASQLEAFTKQFDERRIPVYVTNPQSLEDVFRSIKTIGELLGETERAEKIVQDLQRRANETEAKVKTTKLVRVFFQLAAEPLYTAGKESFITDLIRRAGGESVTANVPGPWPRYSDEAAFAARPEAIIISAPETDETSQASAEIAAPLRKSPAALNGRLYRINADLLTRPGPRLVEGLEQMARALHPEAFK